MFSFSISFLFALSLFPRGINDSFQTGIGRMRFLLQRDQKARIVDGHFSATCAIFFLAVRYYTINFRLIVIVSCIFRDIIAQQAAKSRKAMLTPCRERGGKREERCYMTFSTSTMAFKTYNSPIVTVHRVLSHKTLTYRDSKLSPI